MCSLLRLEHYFVGNNTTVLRKWNQVIKQCFYITIYIYIDIDMKVAFFTASIYIEICIDRPSVVEG